ncbi:uncharacterized protein LOC111019957 isoform X2 [Momordica charantia]|uniref:Uncharacterized protein LOC111019957 isoform X2 n=1 Tax=Momordica charantia TaxID=3673 RepID=A0A6J1DF94_MOMCH|nr:uncharacterized protein LOC111019957 isoform X2 [Momordica charantia]
MATTTADERAAANLEGAELLGQPTFTELDNGRFRCVETGHEVLAKNKDSYSRTKRCRLGLIDFALCRRKVPLNMFEQDPLFCSKLKCKLTGDTINKTEEHIWKHINGRRFLYKLEQKELEKDTLSRSEEQQGKKNAAKASKSSTENSKSKKKKRQDCDNGGDISALVSVAEHVSDGAAIEEEELEEDAVSKLGEQQGKRKASKASKSSTENSKSKKKNRQDCDNGGDRLALVSVSEHVSDGTATVEEELEKDTVSKSGEQQDKRKVAKASKSSTENPKSKKNKCRECDNGGDRLALGSISEHVNVSHRAIATVSKMDPGPINSAILHLQPTHRSQLVWTDQSANCLQCRRREAILHRTINLDARIVPYLKQSGFWGVARIGFTQLDWHLITALVERWRPETHTFHMPGGECTITLQDVAIQFGLPVDGEPVTGSLQHDWATICEDLLGVRPTQLKGSRLSLPWLASQFTKLPVEADEVMIKRYTRAYIMQLIGGFLFADKSNTLVHLMFLPLLKDFEEAGRYSWGSACLAWLYRELCRASQIDALEIAGPLILLQVWAWDRFPAIAPQRKLTTPNEYVGCPLSARWSGSLTVTKVSTHVLSQYRYTFDRLSRNESGIGPIEC